MFNPPPKEPPRPPNTKGLWVPLLCLGLGGLAMWGVVQLSPQKRLLAGRPETALSQLRLPESLQFLEGHTVEAVVSVVLVLALWMMFRRPKSR